MKTALLSPAFENLGIEYVYQHVYLEEKSGDATNQSDSLNLTNIPPNLLSELKNAVVRLDMELIGDILDRIRSHDLAVAEAMSELASSFQFDALLMVVDKQ